MAFTKLTQFKGLYIIMALFSEILFKTDILHKYQDAFSKKTPKIMTFQTWHIFGFNLFSVHFIK